MPDIQPQRELPLRGVAMILISVALLLAMWGIYSMTGGKSAKVNNAASTDSATASAVSIQPAAPAGPVTSAPGVPAPSSGAPAPASAPAGAAASGAAAPGASGGAGTAGAAGAAGASTSAGDKSAVTVHVLNNSTIQGLAAKAKEQLTSQGYRVGQVGNYSRSVVPQNTVYYTDNEQQARELAEKVGGVAQQRPADLPAETAGPGSLVVVLATSFN
ncbi:LytR C-terminal domain-containing protein [uncultured Corynebacterium sp.]|uniref:LytR C-terminal domain-containing protein n=1 Tax=uncultured Corynebacterium sp. TaxID=159447 RepID=UPI0028D15970|nr:LytR C-terminal domain-containing protein [uncultured Corynebacterium sp.]